VRGDEPGSAGARSVPWNARRRRPPRLQPSVALIVTVAAVTFGLSACGGGGSASPAVASAGSITTTTTRVPGSASSAGLLYAKCMRSHGVPDFPDPSSSGGFTFGAGVNPRSPAFKSAQAACQKFTGGLPSPGSATHPSAGALAAMLNIAQCMRKHGVSDFPDPTTSMPSDMTDFEYVSDRDGVILAFARGFDDQSPHFTRAAAACGFRLTNH
jgi:hypothetical protein